MIVRRSLGNKALTAMLMVAVVGVPAAAITGGAFPGSADTELSAAAPPLSSAAWLTLTTSSAGNGEGSVGLQTDKTGAPVETQTLTPDKNCLLGTTETLLKFTGSAKTTTGNAASYASGSLGVAEKKSGTSCSQVNYSSSDKLSLGLNTDSPSLKSRSLTAAKSAVLDVELKQGAQILAVLTLNHEVVGYRELRSGSSIANPQPRPSDDPHVEYPPAKDKEVSLCNDIADSGPDAGIRDNCRWAISKPSWQDDDGVFFDSMELIPLNGSFSVEGGSDGIVQNWSAPLLSPLESDAPSDPSDPSLQPPGGASFFDLVAVDGILDCNAATVTRAEAGTAPEVTVRRLPNIPDPSNPDPCIPIPYSLSNAPSSARFLKPPSDQLVQFVADMVWTVPTSLTTTSLPPTQVDFETPTAGTQVPLGWCPGPVYSGTTTLGGVTVPKLVGITDPLAQMDMDEAPGVQFACVGVQASRVIDGDPDTVKVVEQIYIEGDIKLLR